jgi:hypothetical protein
VSDHEIKAVKDPAVAGYAHAFVAVRPWTVYVGTERLVDRRGAPRRFSTEDAALAAARLAVGAVLCVNCGLTTHARCCSQCGKVHTPKRLDNEHCSAKCERDATHANQISDAMEDDA